MPWKAPTFGAAKRAAERKQYDQHRGSAHQRGYGGKGWESTRRAVFLRDLYTCQDCWLLVGREPRDCHCDHIVPKDKGGTDEIGNLQTLCVQCHTRKTSRGD